MFAQSDSRCLLQVFIILVLALSPVPSDAADWVYTVVEGDNLWDFSEKHLDSVMRFEQIRKINNVANPRRMRPGTRLRVPMQWIKSNPTPARIESILGQVTILRGTETVSVEANTGDPIWLNDSLLTGPDSSVAVQFADGSILTLHHESEMRFDHLSAHGETGMVDSRLRLLKGRVDTRVKPAVGPGSRFEIQTPSAISAVRGTAYRAAVTADNQASNVEVIEGKVRVTGAKKPRLVRAGFGTRVNPGRKPLPPQRLLAAPELEPLPDTIRQLNWPVMWPPIPSANSYRVQIRAQDQPNVAVWDRTVSAARASLPDLDDGDYLLSVRGIGQHGLEGKDRVVRISIDTDPQPPLMLKPNDGQVFRQKPAVLVWTASEAADRYLLEIASDANFEEILLSNSELKATSYQVDELTAPRTYHWRVASIAADGEFGPPGAARSWELKNLPPAIEAELANIDDGTIIATWRKAGPEQRYQAQVARDKSFHDLETDEVGTETSLAITQATRQVRYLRVRTIEPDGYLGPWGTTQRIDPPPDPSVWFIPAIGILGILLL